MSESRTALLNRTQRHIAAFALTYLCITGSIALSIGAIIVFGRLLGFYSSVLWPLAVAGVLALILRPLVLIFERRFKFSRMWAVLLLYTLFLGVLVGIGALTIPKLVDQISNFTDSLPEIVKNGRSYFAQHYPQWADFMHRQLQHAYAQNVMKSMQEKFNAFASQTVPKFFAAGGGLLGIFSFLTHLVIIPVYLFFLLLFRGEPGAKLRSQLMLVPENLRDDLVFLFKEFVGIIESFFRGQMIIGLIMGVLYAIGFSIIGLKFGLFIGLSLGVLNIIPYLGTIIGLLVTIPLALFQPDGGAGLAGLVLMIKAIAQGLEAWVLTPRIMGHQTGLHPFAIIVAIFFWGETFNGVLGMLLAIPLTAFFVTCWRLVRRKYLSNSTV